MDAPHTPTFHTMPTVVAKGSAVILCLGAFLLGACSADEPTSTAPAESSETQTEPREQPAEINPRYLAPRDIQRYPKGSPERAVFDFWIRIQYRDMLSAYRSLTPEFRAEYAPTLDRFSTHVMADHARWLAIPRILFAESNGNEATVGLAYQPPNGVAERSSFSLARSSGGWAVAYNFYLANRLAGN